MNDWREVMGVKRAEPLTAKDLARFDALWAQSCLHDDDESAYLAGIGAMWPTMRPAIFWDITNRAYEQAAKACICASPNACASAPDSPCKWCNEESPAHCLYVSLNRRSWLLDAVRGKR